LSSTQILVLGGLAGVTIFIGLPLGRLQSPDVRLKAALSGMATGILLFLLYDVLAHGVVPVEEALEKAVDEGGSWLEFTWLAVLFAVGAGIGLLSLVYYDGWIGAQRRKKMLGPGAASAAEFEAARPVGLTSAAWLALMIATGIGLHNFSEGLAIGQSAGSGEVALALTLVIGFALHNATEGFGIVAPLSGATQRPTWRFLIMLGIIAGGPTFAGTLIGQAWTSEALSVAFLALAAGSILYVIIELANVNRQRGHKVLVSWALFGGLVLGFATDFVLEAVGG
jgi:zinc transporter, ZIP family